jgi:hypothetical protein
VVQGLPAGIPQPGTVCGTKVQGNVIVNNNMSLVEIGEPTGQQNCPGNRISGSLQCTGNNPVPTGGSNTVQGGRQNQCATF